MQRLQYLISALTIGLVLSETHGVESSSFEAAATVLEHHCIECHGANKSKGGLRMDTHDFFLEGGDNAPGLHPKSPELSEFIKLVSLAHGHEDIMPPEGDALKPQDIENLKKWASDGIPWPVGRELRQRKKMASEAELLNQLNEITIYPPSISLETQTDYHKLIAIGTYQDSTTRDLTEAIRWTLKDPSVARIDNSKVSPKKNGTTVLTAHLGAHSAKVNLSVSKIKETRPITFSQDVMPVLTAMNCNTGSCHGSARGQDGFHLSLFGFDPTGDYQRIIHELPGRRINIGQSEQSLLLTKSNGSVPHTGGKIMDSESEEYQTLLTWIQEGAKTNPKNIALPTKIEVFPKQIVLRGPVEDLQFSVKAYYEDGSDRDVTHLSAFTSNNDNSITVEPNTGLASSKNRGEAFIMARFHTFTEGSQAIVIPAKDNYKKPQIKAFNYVDTHIHRKLETLRILPSEVCSDEVFLRRAYLDIIGKLPSLSERSSFLNNQKKDKRAKLIDELLERPEFAEIWVMKWAELLQIRTPNVGVRISYKSVLLYHQWLRQQIIQNRPFNEIIQELLTSTGSTFTHPQNTYYDLETDKLKLAENFAQVFMGTRIQCAQCHNHPFDQWTMDDYYGMVAFFSQIRRKNGVDPRERIILDARTGEAKNPITKQIVKPRYLGGEAPDLKHGERRELLANWLTEPNNPWFSRNVVNIMWQHFMGIGIVEPVDDVRISNPPSNPELLKALAKNFQDNHYDLKSVVRDICNSRTYSLSSQVNSSNKEDHTNFSHASIRRQRSEILLDSLSQVTNTEEKFKGLPKGASAVQIADGKTSNYFLTTFGRSNRESPCSCEVKLDPNLSQALHLLNGENTHRKIISGKTIPKLIQQKKSDREIIQHLYLQALSREPKPDEYENLLKYLKATNKPKDRTLILEDIFWAILNSKEFIFNH